MQELDEKLTIRFGLPSFKPWQKESIIKLLTGKKQVLVVAPTGGGKSLCYQFPATELPGTSIVVSPLIALMEDQVRGLTEMAIPATWLSSTLPTSERKKRLSGMMRGDYKLVYIAPERLAFEGTLDAISRLSPPLIAIDEAHCISQWGHDFRPDYLKLRHVLEKLRPRHILACTATATPLVRKEIVELLGLKKDGTDVILRGFARPNLHLSVDEIDESSRRRRVMLSGIHQSLGSPGKTKGAAIVYAATRRNAESAAKAVQKEGFKAEVYHAGLDPNQRAWVNSKFADRSLDVVVATNAFGMGIDRPDIRSVIHLQAPGSIEAYYQEVGRAGRDGQPAHGVLLSSSSDFGLRRRLIEFGGSDDKKKPDPKWIDRQWKLFLDLMRYVEAGSCRHDFILKYFGDDQETLGGCGHCDVCEQLEEAGETEGQRSVSEQDALLVRKALSGVARSKQRVGLTAVADMLTGANNAQQKRLGFDNLSTFGLLKDRPKPWVQALLRRLLTAKLVNITGDEYPLVHVTKLGWETMKGDQPVRVFPPPEGAGQPKKKKKKEKSPEILLESLTPTDEVLFESLKKVRFNLAAEKDQPAYIICHDRTLVEMAVRRPTTLNELATVHGMGKYRLEMYGKIFLETIANQ